MLTHQPILRLGLLVCMLLATIPVDAQKLKTRNILILLTDDQGIDKIESYCPNTSADLSCITDPDPDNRFQQVPKTPRLNELAAQGIRFTRAYANPSCSLTRASLLTGLTVPQHGIGTVIHVDEQMVPDSGLDPSIATIASILPDTWTSGALGKWHLSAYDDHGLDGHPDDVSGDRDTTTELCDNETHIAECKDYSHRPTQYGFDYFAGRIRHQIAYKTWAMDRSDGRKREAKWRDRNVDPWHYFTSFITKEAIDFINRNTDRPWLLYVGYQAPHSPFNAPPAPAKLPGVLKDEHTEDYSDAPGQYETIGDTQDRKHYNQLVQSVDYHIGKLLEHVDLSTTTVMFLSDNGTPKDIIDQGYTGRGPEQSKLHMFEAGVRVPMIIAGPDINPNLRGEVQNAITSVRDVFATVAFLSRSTAPVPSSSVNLAQFFDIPEYTGSSPRRYTYVGKERSYCPPYNNGKKPYDNCEFLVRTDRFKLIVGSPNRIQFFKLGTEGAPSAYEAQKTQYDSVQNPLGDLCWGAPHTPLPAEYAQDYRNLRDILFNAYRGSCWVKEHEVNCCDNLDNDGDGYADDLDPDCYCDPDRLVDEAQCRGPDQP